MQHKNQEYYNRIIKYIEYYQIQNGISPTNKEISKGTNLSTATVSRYIAALSKNGELEHNGHRDIRTKRMINRQSQLTRIPIVGRIACGTPIFAVENIEDYIETSNIVRNDVTYFFLRAHGNSMIDAGIDDGDLVLIKTQSTAENGQIVVASIEDEATLKRYYFDDTQNKIRLHPENKTMSDLIIDNCVIQGVAVKVIKDLN